jgi:hypothetical protein
MLGTAALALASAPAALAMVLDPVPEVVRTKPVPPKLDAQPKDTQLSDLSSFRQPDYGSSAEVGNPVRQTLNDDANAAGREIDARAAQLEPDPTRLEWLKGCAKNALWEILYDGVWDYGNGTSFSVDDELNATMERMSQCIQTHFGVGQDVSDPVAAWIMQSITDNGSQVANDLGLSAFINWVAVTAWYSM